MAMSAKPKQQPKPAKSHAKGRGFAVPAEKTTSPSATPTEPSPSPQTPSHRLLLTAFKLVRRHLWPVTVIIAIPGLLGQLGGTLVGGIDPNLMLTRGPSDAEAAGFLLQVIAVVWLFFSFAAYLYFQLRSIGGIAPRIIECYRIGNRYILRLIGLYIFIVLAVGIGLLLLVVPGLIAIRRYCLAPYFLMDEGLGIRQAMQHSAAATKPKPVRRHVWSTLLLVVVVLATGLLATKYASPYGIVVTVLASIVYPLLMALRYQEVSSDIRNGAKALGTLTPRS